MAKSPSNPRTRAHVVSCDGDGGDDCGGDGDGHVPYIQDIQCIQYIQSPVQMVLMKKGFNWLI